jgi:CRP/FNR family transcriptional regulator, nitrogen fixation regulation protein
VTREEVRNMLTQSTALSGSIYPQVRRQPLRADEGSDSDRGLTTFDRIVHDAGINLSYLRGAEIFGEDEPAEHLYKVVSGAVCTYKILNDGRRQITGFYLPDEFFGLQYSDAYCFSAEAIKDAKIMAVKRSILMTAAKSDAVVSHRLLLLTAIELSRAQNRVLLLAKNAQERVVGFLLEMAARSPSGKSIQLPMLRQDIADYLGLTIETVSRTLKSLKNLAAIEVSTRHIVIRNRSTLVHLNG